MQFPELLNKKIAILGFWREGKSTLHFLLNQGVKKSDLTILDKKEVNEPEINSVFWEDYLNALDQYDLIFKTAGIQYTPEIRAVQEKTVTQVQFFFNHFPGKVVALSASKGKTTMTSLTYQLLKDAGFPVVLAGNIGKPVLDEIDFDNKDQYVVIELSSFMLETLKKKNLISILGAIFPVHLDWHGSMEDYVQAKKHVLDGAEKKILFSSTKEQYLPEINLDHVTLTWKGTDFTWDESDLLVFWNPFLPRSEIKLLGEHNLRNICAIIALGFALKIDEEQIKTTISNFTAVRHRLQLVGTFKGISFYDDAISTSPFSTIAALDALWDQVDTLFLGGVDGWYDFSWMVERIKKSQISNLVLFPDSGERIAKMLGDDAQKFKILHTREMKEGVEFSYQNTKPWKIALLSTATPSFSLWKDFEEKGDLFQKFVKELGEK